MNVADWLLLNTSARMALHRNSNLKIIWQSTDKTLYSYSINYCYDWNENGVTSNNRGYASIYMGME